MQTRDLNMRYVIAKQGDTGYANHSTLTFITVRRGRVTMPHLEWRESDFPTNPYEIMSLELTIPSGQLIIKNKGGSMPLDVEETEDDQFVFRGDDSSWSGKVAGLEGGMSGYGGHHIESTAEAIVTSGVYLEPLGDSSNWSFNPRVPYEQYRQRLYTSNLLFDYTKGEVREEYDQRRMRGEISDTEWKAYIRKIDKAYIASLTHYEVWHTIQYSLKEDLRWERCEDKISDTEWNGFVKRLENAVAADKARRLAWSS